MHWDGTISLGNLLSGLAFVAALWWRSLAMTTSLDRRLISFEKTLELHATTLQIHATKMDRQEDMTIRLVGEVQRLIGRLDAQTLRLRATDGIS